MEQHEVYELFEKMDAELQTILETTAQLREVLSTVMAENNQLRLTNDELKELLVKRQQADPQENSAEAAPSAPEYHTGQERLQRYYDEGIHVCHPYFGSRRLPEEECLLCLGVIDGLSQKKEDEES